MSCPKRLAALPREYELPGEVYVRVRVPSGRDTWPGCDRVTVSYFCRELKAPDVVITERSCESYSEGLCY